MHENVKKYLENWDDIEWSASRVSSFMTCPYNFYGTYILKLSSDNYFAYRGSMVHEIMEEYYSYMQGLDIPLETMRWLLIKKFDYLMDKCPHEAVSFYVDKKGKVGKMAMNHNKIIESLKNWTPMSSVQYVEREIKFPVHGYNFRAFLDFERGYDKLMPNGKHEPITWHGDYKSVWDVKKYKFQQYLYMYGKELVDDKRPVGFEVIEYKNNFKPVVMKYDKTTIKFVTSKAKDTIEDIKKALETDCFPKQPKDKFFCMNLCRMCEHGRAKKE